jgi:hypothetical protein
MDFDKTCLISKDLVDNHKKVRFMYKEQSYKEMDSGWRFFSGDATQEYVDNADNLLLVTLNYVINNVDSSVEKYLNSQIGIAYERENANDDFIKSNFNFEIEE